MRPDVIEVRGHIHVNDAGLVLHNRLRHTPDGIMGGALGAIAVRTRLAVRFNDGFQDELEGSLDPTVTIVGIDSTRTPFPPSLGIAWCRNRMGRYVRVTSACRICSRNASSPLASMASCDREPALAQLAKLQGGPGARRLAPRPLRPILLTLALEVVEEHIGEGGDFVGAPVTGVEAAPSR